MTNRPVTEAEARRHFLDLCFPSGVVTCPRCSAERIYGLKDERMRCGGCGYTFHYARGRYLGMSNLTDLEWVRVIDGFAEGRTAKSVATEIGRSYKTVYAVDNVLRTAMAASLFPMADLLDDKGRLKDACCKGEVDLGESPASVCAGTVFRVRSDRTGNGGPLVAVSRCEGLNAWNLLIRPKGKTRWRNFFCQWEDGRGEMVLSCCYKTIRRRHFIESERDEFSAGPLAVFFDFFKTAIDGYNCFSPDKTPLYLGEIAYRYNHRGQDLFEPLARLVCAFTPVHAAARPLSETSGAGAEIFSGCAARGRRNGSETLEHSPQEAP